MKFLYEYRTGDNVRHEGAVCAANREAAFAALRARGIRPSRMTEAPGLLNMLLGKGKRWTAIIVLSVLAAALAVALVRVPSGAQSVSLDDTTRRQVFGDAAVIEKGLRTGWAAVFPDDGERFLAGFAVPGVPVAVERVDEAELKAALARRIAPAEGDPIEHRQIKAMVEGVKDELRAFLAAGGSIRQYARLLVQRQDEEIGYYERAKRELAVARKSGMADSEIETLWEKRNNELRQMGIRLVSLPDDMGL